MGSANKTNNTWGKREPDAQFPRIIHRTCVTRTYILQSRYIHNAYSTCSRIWYLCCSPSILQAPSERRLRRSCKSQVDRNTHLPTYQPPRDVLGCVPAACFLGLKIVIKVQGVQANQRIPTCCTRYPSRFMNMASPPQLKEGKRC